MIMGFLLLLTFSLTACFSNNETSDDGDDLSVKYTITTNVLSGEGGIKLSPQQEKYEKGTEVKVEAIPEDSYSFKNWTGGLSGEKKEQNIVIDTDLTIGAEFIAQDKDTTPPSWNLVPEIKTKADENSIGINASIDEPGKIYYKVQTTSSNIISATEIKNNGQSISVVADVAEEILIEGLVEDIEYDIFFTAEDQNNNLQKDDKVKKVTFTTKKIDNDDEDDLSVHTIKTNILSGAGEIKLSPQQEKYEKGTEIKIEAIPEDSYSFKNWTGGLSGEKKEQNIVIDTDLTIGAEFIAQEEDATPLTPGEMVIVPQGTYSPRLITMDYDLEVGKYEVTNAEFVDFLNNSDKVSETGHYGIWDIHIFDSRQIDHNGTEFYLKEWSDPNGNPIDVSNYPVVEVNFYGAAAYCNWLSEQQGLEPAYKLIDLGGTLKYEPENTEGYRLPTDIEWEYAAAGGSQESVTSYAGSDNLDEVGWCSDNSDVAKNSNLSQGKGTMPVGQKLENELGLYDMSGNVWELTNTFTDHYYKSSKFIRGGSWQSNPSSCKVIHRESVDMSYGKNIIGFRIVRTKQ